jgi:hypothetical protein
MGAPLIWNLDTLNDQRSRADRGSSAPALDSLRSDANAALEFEPVSVMDK